MGTREKQYKSSVYLDYQASTPLDSRVLTAMHPYLTTEFANPHASEHALGWEANKATDSAVQRVSSSIGCDRI
jgi:cysteine desulfurase